MPCAAGDERSPPGVYCALVIHGPWCAVRCLCRHSVGLAFMSAWRDFADNRTPTWVHSRQCTSVYWARGRAEGGPPTA